MSGKGVLLDRHSRQAKPQMGLVSTCMKLTWMMYGFQVCGWDVRCVQQLAVALSTKRSDKKLKEIQESAPEVQYTARCTIIAGGNRIEVDIQ